MNRGLAKYVAVVIVVLVVGGVLLSLGFRGPGDATAIWVSAGVALVSRTLPPETTARSSAAGTAPAWSQLPPLNQSALPAPPVHVKVVPADRDTGGSARRQDRTIRTGRRQAALAGLVAGRDRSFVDR